MTNYWLVVDTVRIPDALKQISNMVTIETTIPLFVASDFDHLMAQSPLLLNLGADRAILKKWASLPLFDSSSIMLAFPHADGYELLWHLQKLLIVNIDEKKVLFRFYTNAIWKEIAGKLNDRDTNLILGDITNLYWLDDEKNINEITKKTDETSLPLNDENALPYKLTSPVFKKWV